MKFPLVALVSALTLTYSFAQSTPPVNGYAFERSQETPVFHGTDALDLAWVGGLNYTSMANLDLDFDGQMDLLVFEKDGRRLLPFLVKNVNGQIRYSYHPELAKAFPKIDNWIITADANCDGKLDLFCGVNQYIQVFYNTSSSTELSFQKAHGSTYLKTLIRNSYVQDIYSISSDVPAVIDLNNDGNIDLLTLNQNTGRVDAHINQANCGLDYSNDGECWGLFTESGVANDVMLNACNQGTAKTMHAGGSLLALDLDQDNRKDLLMSDPSYNDVVALFNKGTLDSAVITSKILNWPSNQSINLYVYPAMHYADIDLDGKKDLIVSPNNTNSNPTSGGGFSGPKNRNNTLVYKNSGQNNNPTFSLLQNNFLQEHMVEVGELAVPRFVDLNGDSLQDLIVASGGEFVTPGNYRTYLHYYVNTGTRDSASFDLNDSDFVQLSSYNFGSFAIPTFGDLDGDGDQDMLVGDGNGRIHYFRNNGSPSSPNFGLQQAAINNIDVGGNAAPFLFDLNGDQTLDLVVGNTNGTLSYFTNNSSSSPSFTLVTNLLGGLRLTSYINGVGHSIPVAFRDTSGNINLFVGTRGEGVWQLDSIGSQIGSTSSREFTLGRDSILVGNHRDSPFGTRKRTGRNQMLFRHSELQAEGMGFGYIDAIYLYCEVPSSLNPPYTFQNGININMANTSRNDLSGVFETNLQNHASGLRVNLNNGWNRIELTEPFLYDGTSNIAIEICFSRNFTQAANIAVRTSPTAFTSYAWGDSDKNNFNDPLANGCAMPYDASANARPNIKFEQSPAFAVTDYLFTDAGFNTAPDLADLNNDGFLDAIVGNAAGGIQLFMGKKYVNDVSLEESIPTSFGFVLYPNPASSEVFLERETNQVAEVQLLSIDGKLLQSLQVREKRFRLSTAQFSPGVYFIRVIEGGQSATQKLILY